MNQQEAEHLERVGADVREIKEAVLGNEKIGLPGLVNDVRDLKCWRSQIDLRTAGIAGFTSAVVLLVKAFFGR